MTRLTASIVGLVLCAVLMPSLALADPLLEQTTGTWTGRGWFKQSPDAPAEATRCRIHSRFDAPSRRLILRGRCAVAGRSGAFDAHIASHDGGLAYDGHWSSQLAGHPATLAGRRRGNAIHFDVRATDRQSGAPLRGRMIWQLGEGRFMIRNSRTMPAGGSVVVGEMVFDR